MDKLLREYYDTFGMPNEGPHEGDEVGASVRSESFPTGEFEALRTALDDPKLGRQFRKCRDILDDLASRLTSNALLRELSEIGISSEDFEQLSTGVFWFSLAASLDRREGGLPVTPFDQQFELSLPNKVMMTVQGSLVLRLYVSLVYMREGVLKQIVHRGAGANKACCRLVKQLLVCDYVRHIRNALGHGTFSPNMAGISFRNNGDLIVATPGFLSWMCTWLMLIQLQALAVASRDGGNGCVSGERNS